MISMFNTIEWGGLHQCTVAFLAMLFVMACLTIKYFKFRRILKNIVSSKFKNLLIKNGSSFRFIMRLFLYFVGFGFLMLALLQPQWGKQEEVVEQEGRDLLIAVDVSRSMLAQDQAPNRLEFAKQKIKKLLYNLSCERVGLILFSGSTILQCPLTTDYSAFFMFLDQIDAETISSGTTSIDQAIKQAVKVFDLMEGKKTKLLCIFTDGEDFSTDLTDVKQRAAKQGLSVVTFGIGSEHGAPIPIVDQAGNQDGFEKDQDGSIIMSRLNQATLRSLSEQTGGKYIHATESDEDVASLITFVKSFEKDKMDSKKVGRLQERYHYFVAVSFVCFVLEWLL